MLKMFFRCHVCDKTKLKTKSVFTVEITGDLITKDNAPKLYICKKCGDYLNAFQGSVDG